MDEPNWVGADEERLVVFGPTHVSRAAAEAPSNRG